MQSAAISRIQTVLGMLVMFCFLQGCSTVPDVVVKPPAKASPKISKKKEEPERKRDVIGKWLSENGMVNRPTVTGYPDLLDSLYQHFDIWRGVPYQSGGMSKDGVDCSGFAKLTFAELFRINLPRNTTDQSLLGFDVELSDLRTGDLVFFKIDRSTQHVGIYLQNAKFLHASTSKGVEIADINDQYWRGRYWKSVRIPALLF